MKSSGSDQKNFKLCSNIFMKLNFPIVYKEYRPELNALRAVAVLLVLLFHLDVEWMQGGFLGVGVF
jgi:peptidoglycan/LPS O-acetylase OafA/YrhL